MTKQEIIDNIIKKEREQYIDTDSIQHAYLERRGATLIAGCLEFVESFIDKNDLKPQINDIIKGKTNYSIAYNPVTRTLETCVAYSEFVLPFFMFDDEEKAQKVIDNCKGALFEIFSYFIFAGGKA